VAKLVLIDVPLSPEAKLPLRLKPLTVPFAGAFACQDALIAERTLEAGSKYVMDLADADIYRYPYLSSSQAGVALLETVKQAKLPDLGQRLTKGLSAGAGWDTPTLLLTGDADKYLRPEAAEAVAAANPGAITAKTIEAAGHQPQEDYPQLVVQALASFLR
jgi:pimeloyl-ACP methyl ester carboxylesterase